MIIDIAQILIGASVTAAVGTIAYFGKRIISKENQREKASLYNSYASIAATMKSQKLTIDDMEIIAKYLNVGDKNKSLSEGKFDPAELESNEFGSDTNYWTQLSANDRAHASHLASAAKLNEIVTEYRTMLDEYELEIFDRLQINWENYRDIQAKIESSRAEGGSLQPLLFSGEHIALNNQRIIAVEVMINELKKMYGSSAI